MLNMFKKKKPSQEERLEALLNGSERESAQETDTQGHQSRQEAQGSEAKGIQLNYANAGPFQLFCYGQGDIPHLYKGPSEAVTALVNNSIQMLRPQVSPEKQTSLPQTEILKGKLPLVAGRRYQMVPGLGLREAQILQRDTLTFPDPLEISICSAHQNRKPDCPLCNALDNQQVDLEDF